MPKPNPPAAAVDNRAFDESNTGLSIDGISQTNLVRLVRFSDYDAISTIEPMESSNSLPLPFFCSSSCATGVVPVSRWLPKYEWKACLLHDLVAGITVAVMHVPQGLAYALLCGVPPVVGLYMGAFPVVVYFIFGTSRHLSVGSFAPLAIMTGAIVQDYKCSPASQKTPTLDGCEIEIAATVALWVGFWQLIAYMLQLGFFATILSKTLVSAFTAGAGFHILLSQMPDFFGIQITTSNGMFRLIHTIINIAKSISSTHVPALVTSVLTCIVLLIDRVFIKPRLEAKINFGLPIELILIGLGIILTKFCNLHEIFALPIIGEIPQGLRIPKLAFYTPIEDIYLKSILVALVGYAIATSVSFHLANKCSYEIDPNQEFLALGLANIVASFFLCFPIGGSMSRTMVQYKSGGKSQLAGVFCAVILIVIVLWVGPIFETVPKSVLAGIIVMALYTIIAQLAEFPSICKVSKQDGVLWIATFLGVIIFDIAYGLAIGVLVAFLFIYYHSTTPYICALGRINLAQESQSKESDHMFIDLRHSQASEIPGIRIIQIASSLHFANRAVVKKKIEELAGVSPHSVFKLQRKMRKAKKSDEVITEKVIEMKTVEWRFQSTSFGIARSPLTSYYQTKEILQYIILDLSLVEQADQSSIVALQHIISLYREIEIEVVVTSKDPILEAHLTCYPHIRTAITELIKIRQTGNNVDSS